MLFSPSPKGLELFPVVLLIMLFPMLKMVSGLLLDDMLQCNMTELFIMSVERASYSFGLFLAYLMQQIRDDLVVLARVLGLFVLVFVRRR
jgi:hypothetical protein